MMDTKNEIVQPGVTTRRSASGIYKFREGSEVVTVTVHSTPGSIDIAVTCDLSAASMLSPEAAQSLAHKIGHWIE